MRSLRTKISITYVIVSFVVVTLLGVLLSFEFERSLRERVIAELNTTTMVVHSFLLETAPKQAWKRETISTLDAIASSTGIRVTLIDDSGIVLYESAVPDSLRHLIANHYMQPEVLQASRRGTGSDVRMSETIAVETMYYARRVDEKPFEQSVFPRLKYVRAGIFLSEINSRIMDIRLKIALAAVLVFLVTLLVTRVVVQKVTGPIEQMSEEVKQIRAGNYDIRLRAESKDELAELASNLL